MVRGLRFGLALVAAASVSAACSGSSSSSSTATTSRTTPSSPASAAPTAAVIPARVVVQKHDLRVDRPPLLAGFGTIWSASSSGLLTYSPQGRPSVALSTPAKDIGLSARDVVVLADGAPRLLAVDPHSHRVVRRVRLGANGVSLAVSGNEAYAVQGAGQWRISRVDLQSGAVASHALPGSLSPVSDRSVAVGAGAVWFATATTVYKLDSQRLTVVRSVTAPFGLTSIWFGDGALWAASDSHDGGVVRLDPASMRFGAVQDSDAIQIAFTPDRVWLAAADGPTALNPAGTALVGAVPARVVVDQSAAGIAVVGSRLWVNYPEAHVIQVLAVSP